MERRNARATLVSFFLYAKSGAQSQPVVDKISVVALYAVATAFVISSIANLFPAISAGHAITLAFLSGYIGLSLASLIAFWMTRRLVVGKIFLGAGVLLLLAQQIVDGGGAYGFGVLYLMLGFPALYLLVGFKTSIAYLVVYDIAVFFRILEGSFPRLSILSYPGVSARMIVVLGIATAMQFMICACLEFLMRRLIRLAYYDPVSGLPNRAKIWSILRNEISFYGERAAKLSVVAIKILNLGKANAMLGAERADRLLEEIGSRLSAFTGKRDSAGRWSSSILIAVARMIDPGGLEAYSRDLVERLSRPYSIDGRTASAIFTLAISRYPEDARSADQLVANAISLLAQGDRQPGEIRFFDQEAMRLQQKRYAIIEELESADYDREFRLAYQPIMSLPKARCVGAEILLRWKGRDGVDIPPGVFIPLAEQSGAIRKITRWVITRCVSDLAQAGLAQAPGLSFAVNLSVLDLRDRDFPDFVEKTLADAACPGLRLEFEITEGVMLDDDPRTRRNIEKLLSSGSRISIDDFGTGYSSLSYLHRIKAHGLKIDQSFIRSLSSSGGQDEGAVIEAIISMGKALKLETTAEGVEKEEQLEFLRARGCDEAQGFLFSPGIPFPEFLEFLKTHRA